MKRILFAICGGALLWTGCKENEIPVDFSVKAVSDTTYVLSPVPSSSPHQVLVEEFTGQSCPNCPGAHADLDAISASHPGLINVVSLYADLSPQSHGPALGGIYDLRDSVALDIAKSVYNAPSALPAAGIDRISVGGSRAQIGDASWGGLIGAQLAIADDSVNVSITSSYNATANQATITAGVTYTHPVSTPQNLSIVIVQDSISDMQDFLSGGVQAYTFLDVFRGMVTSAPNGDVLQVSGGDAKEAGRFFQKVYSYSVPVRTPVINPAHCRVIAFVNTTSGSDKHVMQSAQCALTK